MVAAGWLRYKRQPRISVFVSIHVFFQKALLHLVSPVGKDETFQVKAASCACYSRLPYDICSLLSDFYAAFFSQ